MAVCGACPGPAAGGVHPAAAHGSFGDGGYGKDGRQDGFFGTAWPPPGCGGGEILQPLVALAAIDGCVQMGTIPKATASLANFQMNAQFHDSLSRKLQQPAAGMAAGQGKGTGDAIPCAVAPRNGGPSVWTCRGGNLDACRYGLA